MVRTGCCFYSLLRESGSLTLDTFGGAANTGVFLFAVTRERVTDSNIRAFQNGNRKFLFAVTRERVTD